MWSSPPTMNTSKLHLHVEQFSLKTNWKPAEGLLYNQGCMKDMHIIRQEGKKSVPVPDQDLGLWEGTQRKMMITWVEVGPGE